jgi:hypothetical protein
MTSESPAKKQLSSKVTTMKFMQRRDEAIIRKKLEDGWLAYMMDGISI